MLPFTRRTLPLPEERGQGLIEYALILSLVAILIIVALAVMGTAVESAYCQFINQFSDDGNPCTVDEVTVDVVVITRADYTTGPQMLHLDATSDGDYNPAVTLTASPGGVMEETGNHYHLDYFLPGCPCEVTIISSAGGSASVNVIPPT